MDLWVTERYQGVTSLGFKVVQTLHHSQSAFQTVDVVETEAYGRMLLLDGAVMTTERDEYIYHEMISHIPMLSHPEPKNVLVIGGGDGGTIREVLRHPSVERVVLCEIDGEVVEVSKKYLPSIASAFNDPRVDVQIRDGIAYMAEQENAFDVILIDATDPAMEGPGQVLFTDEFYQNTMKALTENGIMASQTDSPIAVPQTFKWIYQRLLNIFPVAQPYLAVVPTYPGGMWSWSFCSKSGHGPFAYLSDERAYEIEQHTKYYNRQIHRAAFAMPNFIRTMMMNKEPASC